MATTPLPRDFREFLKLLNEHGAEYLLIGGYAVGYHGYPRATADMDVWVSRTRANAERVAAALREFGFALPEVTPELFLEPDRIVRMGVPPLRLEITTGISGVEFADCYGRRVAAVIDGLPVSVIALADLRTNKQASGRHKDLADLEQLP